MYVSLHFPFAPQYFPQKTRFVQRFLKEDVQKHTVFSDFRPKDAGSPSQQKSRQGESSLGPLFCDSGSPKTTFSGTSPNCRAVRGPPPKTKPTYLTSGAGGGKGGGVIRVILYPLVSIRHAEQCQRILICEIGLVNLQLLGGLDRFFDNLNPKSLESSSQP